MTDDDNIVILPVVTRLDIPADRVLNDVLASGVQSAIIIGYDNEGNEYFQSSIADGGEVLWLLERTKLQLLRKGDTE